MSFRELNNRLVSTLFWQFLLEVVAISFIAILLEKGCILLQHGKVVAYVSRLLKNYEQNYPTHDLKVSSYDICLKYLETLSL